MYVHTYVSLNTVYQESFVKENVRDVSDYHSDCEKMFANLVIQLQFLVINKTYKKMLANAPGLAKYANSFFSE